MEGKRLATFCMKAHFSGAAGWLTLVWVTVLPTAVQGASLPVQPGTFTGLFQEVATPRHETSGFITIKVTPQGALSGQLIAASGRHAFSGRWPTNGAFPVLTVNRRGTNALILSLFPATPDALEGTVSDGTWVSILSAERLIWHRTLHPATHHAGKFTASIDRSDGPDRPNGYGYGTFTIDAGGMVTFSGVLGDGTKVAQKSALGVNGAWPIYLSPYASKGSIFGWVPSDNSTNTASRLCWHKASVSPGTRYPTGFAITPPIWVSPYTPPAKGLRILNITQGYVTLEGGLLAGPVVNELSLTAGNTIVSLGRNPLTLTFNLKNGLLAGTATIDGTRLKFGGIVFQAVDMGVGHFLSPSQSGAVIFAGDSQ